ncbi:MAG: UDP-N-acetylmuramoyl-L-alanyl-D-glutamate--2,6-diaminopimelate ligase [candidate division WOR-3 bacterium]
MKLRELAMGYEIIGELNPEITDIVYDSRMVVPGALYCAITGRNADGHMFINDAERAGAAALLVSRDMGSRLPRILAEDTRKAMAILSDRFFGHPSGGMKLIGITGTAGKSTTAFIIHSALRALGHQAALITTVQYSTPKATRPAERTTPEAPDLQRLLKQALEEGADFGVMEVSSHGVAEHRILGLEFSAGAFTNLGRDHLDYHGTIEAYAEAKLEFFRMLPQDAVAAINADDPWAFRFAQETPAKAIFYSLNGRGEIRVRVLSSDAEGLALEFEMAGQKARTLLPLVGLHNAGNAGAALAVLVGLGFELGAVASAFRSAKGPPGRFEKVSEGKDFLVIVDYAHTPEALSRALSAARLLTKGRLHLVFGCGGNRDKGKRPLMGRAAEEGADSVILTTDNPRDEEPSDIIREILSGMETKPLVIPDRREAIRAGIRSLGPGDVLLIAGKGHEEYMEIKGQRIPFSDRQVAVEVMNEIQAG